MIIEDEYKLIEILQAYLTRYGYESFYLMDGSQAIETIKQNPPDLILLDLMLPHCSGEEIIKAVRSFSMVPIIVLSAKSQEQDIIQALQSGADDYQVKPFSPKEVMARIQSVLRRSGKHHIQKTYDHGRVVIDETRRLVKKEDVELHLTKSEYAILIELIHHPNRIYSREQLIDVIFGKDYDGFDRSIDVHIRNLRVKMEDDSKHPRYIKTRFGVGYYFDGEAL